MMLALATESCECNRHFGKLFELQDPATIQKQLTLLPLSVRMQKILLRKNVEIHFCFSTRGAGLPPSCSGLPQVVVSTFCLAVALDCDGVAL
jgi:hypothetical protein